MLAAGVLGLSLSLLSQGNQGVSGRSRLAIAGVATPTPTPQPLPGKLPSSPIKHIILILEENRSYDNLFGQYPGADGVVTGTADIGGRDFVFPLIPETYYAWHDLAHGDHDAVVSIDHGKMDGFSNEAYSDLYGEKAAYQQVRPGDVPNLYAYAKNFVLSDRTFSPEPGSTFVNHLHAVSGQDGGAVGNPANPQNDTSAWGCDSVPGTYVQKREPGGRLGKMAPCFSFPTLADRLNEASLSWAYYAAPPSNLGYIFSTLDAFKQIRETSQWTVHVKDEDTFQADARAGRLPAFSWVTPRIGSSMHPPEPVCPGESWIVTKLNALMSGPDWDSSLVIVTWDEWGGYYDHVAPPPRSVGPYGPRVPLLIISPFARRGYVTHTVYSLESVLRTAEKLWGVPPLTAMDETANDMLDSLNLSQAPLPPLLLRPRACPPNLTRAQFNGYLAPAVERAITATLGVSWPQVELLHRTQTLAQIAATHDVSPTALLNAVETTAEAWAEGKIVLQLIKPSDIGPETNRAVAVVDKLYRSSPGSAFFP